MGIFDTEAALFTIYRAKLVFRDRLMGGVPRHPKIIEGWLRAKMSITDEEELMMIGRQTLIELGYPGAGDMTYEEISRVVEEYAESKHTNGFKRDEHGLYIESRQVKAMLKECMNVLYATERMGPTKKGAKSFLAERVFIDPNCIHLGRMEPDGVGLVIGHVRGPQGPQSNLTYHEYVDNAEITFTVKVTEDAIPHVFWPRLWVQAQDNGLGAVRSQGYGRFDIEAWEVIANCNEGPTRIKKIA